MNVKTKFFWYTHVKIIIKKNKIYEFGKKKKKNNLSLIYCSLR